jgi:4-amino-4-deoxy-L-arabinose transferase-like glycosyltransferase
LSSRTYYVLAVLVLLLAAALRIWQLTTVPIGFSEPELAHIDLMRDEIQHGNIRVFYELDSATNPDGVGQEGLYHNILALSSFAFGEGTFGLRMLSVFAGIITVAMMYSLGVRIFGYLAGLASATLLAVMMWMILLSRLVLVETLIPLFVTAVLLMLVRTMPVYQRARAETTNTVDFAVLGALLGLGLYLHPASLFVLLLAVIFVTYIIIWHSPILSRRMSYIGFALLMLVIIAIPYLLSSIRLPELAATGRLFGEYGSIPASIIDSIGSLLWRGDDMPIHNFPNRPLVDTVSGVLILFGAILAALNWRKPRYALVLMAAVILAPPAILSDHSPNFMAMTVLIPIIALFFGLGLSTVLHQMPRRTRFVGILGVLALLVFNLYWTANDLFVRWTQLEDVQIAYNSDIGQLANYLDLTAGDVPTILCYPNWNVERNQQETLNNTELLLLHMNRDTAPMRYVDCRTGFLFINAGEQQQVVIASSELYGQIPANIMAWLSMGTVRSDIPNSAVIEMQVQAELFDALGVFTTTAPASFPTDTDISERVPVPPDIRFGGNITWLGYDLDLDPIYTPNSNVFVTTYWRIEGLVPSDLLIFTHILSDPSTIAANRDSIAVNPTQLQERDIYLHIADIPLAENEQDGDYVISVGVYQASSDERLPVFGDNNEVRGDRIFLYPITIETPETEVDNP